MNINFYLGAYFNRRFSISKNKANASLSICLLSVVLHRHYIFICRKSNYNLSDYKKESENYGDAPSLQNICSEKTLKIMTQMDKPKCPKRNQIV